MTLVIRTTGLEQYAPGGEARLKLLIIGGPGVGKTRFASFFPRPIYADCEAGLASVADRRMSYVSVASSTDMLDLLTHLKLECRLPKEKRTYDTVVIDTLDAYQRKLKNEWMEREKKEAFTGWEAWGFVGQKMSLLLTKLLNLDMNVIVNVHYKDKITKDDDTGKETHELMLQLQGEISDTAFNDFDQVGWMGTYWEAVGGERVHKRGLTFKPTPDKPFLKDRLNVTTNWMEIQFTDNDYLNLFTAVSGRLDKLAPTQVVGEIPSADPEATVSAAVVRPEMAESGPLPPQPPAEIQLNTLDKPSLLKLVRDLHIIRLVDGTPIKGNTLKGELIEAIEAHYAKAAAQPDPPAEPLSPVVEQVTKAAEPTTQPRVPRQANPPAVEQVAEGLVDTKTGELVDQGRAAVLEGTAEPTIEQAITTVQDVLGGVVVAETPPEKTPAATAAVARQVAAKTTDPAVCEDCGKDLSDEKSDYVKLAWIKFRKRLCQTDYQKRRNG